MNLNDTVEVVLTEYGKSIVDEHIRKLEIECHAKFKELYKYDKNGKLSVQLFDLMNIFGHYINIDEPQVFRNNEITLIKEKL